MAKKKAMSTAKASYKKTVGHVNEMLFCKKFGISEPNPGQGKVDCLLNGRKFSLKRGYRYQMALYSNTSTVWNNLPNHISDKIMACLNVFPDTREEYRRNKSAYNENLKEPMVELKEVLEIKENLEAYLNFIFRDNEVEAFAIRNTNGIQHIFDADEFIDVLIDNIIVRNSKARNQDELDNQKVLFKIKINNRELNLVENEIRRDSVIHYKQWLSICIAFSPSKPHGARLLPLLQREIIETNIIQGHILNQEELNILAETYNTAKLRDFILSSPINQPAIAYGNIIDFMNQVEDELQ